MICVYSSRFMHKHVSTSREICRELLVPADKRKTVRINANWLGAQLYNTYNYANNISTHVATITTSRCVDECARYPCDDKKPQGRLTHGGSGASRWLVQFRRCSATTTTRTRTARARTCRGRRARVPYTAVICCQWVKLFNPAGINHSRHVRNLCTGVAPECTPGCAPRGPKYSRTPSRKTVARRRHRCARSVTRTRYSDSENNIGRVDAILLRRTPQFRDLRNSISRSECARAHEHPFHPPLFFFYFVFFFVIFFPKPNAINFVARVIPA